MTNFASGCGFARSTSDLNETPRQMVSFFVQRVTQWMSPRYSVLGSARNSSEREIERLVAKPVDLQAPRLPIEVGHVAHVQHGEALGERLTRRNRRIFLFEERHRTASVRHRGAEPRSA